MITLKPGRNLIKFVANNISGPAGFMMSVFGPDGKVLFRTDKTWFFRDAYAKVKPVSAADLNNWPVYQDSTVSNIIRTDTTELRKFMWNPVGSSGHESPIVYKVKVDFGRSVKLANIIFYTVGDRVHDPTGVRVYVDQSKSGLLASYGSLESRRETSLNVDAQYTKVSSVYVELDKSTPYQIWLQRIIFVEAI
jgi:hypothetical protein